MITIAINDFLILVRRYEEMAEWLRIQHDAARDKDASAELERICQQDVGLPLSVIRHSSPEEISALLRQGINPQGRSIVLAELLILESELNEREGDAAGQVRASLQAFCLLGEGAESLSPEVRDQVRVKLEKLALQLRRAGDDPYLRQKLSQFGY